jgi:hypothetical protein
MEPRTGGPGVPPSPSSELAVAVGLAEALLRLRVPEEDQDLVIAGQGHTPSMALSATIGQS